MGRDLLTVPAAGLTGPTGVCLARADAALRDAGLQYGDVADEELREADLWLLHGHKKKSRRVQPQRRSFNFQEGRPCRLCHTRIRVHYSVFWYHNSVIQFQRTIPQKKRLHFGRSGSIPPDSVCTS